MYNSGDEILLNPKVNNLVSLVIKKLSFFEQIYLFFALSKYSLALVAKGNSAFKFAR